MNSEVILALIALASSGGVVYLIVDKLFSRKQERADATTTIISNSNEVAELYNKIDEIVSSKLRPIEDELKDIKTHWCCYREECEMRLITRPIDYEKLHNESRD